MKKLLNTLYVTTQGAYLKKDGETIAVKVEGNVRLRLPIHTIGSIVCFGNVSCSPFLLGFCAQNDVAVSFLTENGRFLAKVTGPVSGNVLLRRQQYRWADDLQQSARVASYFLIGKLFNCRTVLERAKRDHKDKIEIERISRQSLNLKHGLYKIQQGTSLDVLRGIEGDAANSYFAVFNELITNQKDSFPFSGRKKHPPTDRVNCLLSFVYTILLHDIRSALETVGLDPQVGFLHRDRPGRPSLALDLMEEFRPVIADRLVLSLINLNQVRIEGFIKKESGIVLMNEDTRKTVLSAYQKRKRDVITHPLLRKKMYFGNIFYVQAQLLARYIRGDIDGYPPFLWK